ncbi:hypothetical protein O9G_005754, partial [Rozella allomycis CSF55]
MTIQRIDRPNLLDSLANSLNTANVCTQLNILGTFYALIKMFCTLQLPAKRKQFYEKAPLLFNYLFELCQRTLQVESPRFKIHAVEDAFPTFLLEVFNHFLARGQELRIIKTILKAFIQLRTLQVESPNFDLLHLCLKCICKLYIQGFKNHAVDDAFPTFLLEVFNHFLARGQELRIIKTIFKAFIQLETTDPCFFSESPPCMTLVQVLYDYIRERTISSTQEIEKLIILKTFVLFRGLLEFLKMNHSENDISKERMNLAKERIQNYFDETKATSICEILITRYFVCTEEECQGIMNEPEEYISQEEADNWQFNSKVCSSFVFQELVNKYRNVVCPMIANLFYQTINLPLVSENEIDQKCAVYDAINFCAADLCELIDFDQALRT